MNVKGFGFLAFRYLRTRRKARGVGGTWLSWLGLCVGVLSLNAVLAVMNGFQLTFIESLLELSSSHLRWAPDTFTVPDQLISQIQHDPEVRSIVPTTDGQTLVSTHWGTRRAAEIRGFPTDTLSVDTGFAHHLHLSGPALGLPAPGQVLLGQELARALGVGVGDTVSLTSLTGPTFSLLKPTQVQMTVKGTFTTGYYEIDSGWILANIQDTQSQFASPQDFFYAIKLKNGNADQSAVKRLSKAVHSPRSEWSTWRDYNSAFFGALRTEKAVMMLLVGLMFFVVGVNIFFSQRRAVLEHREDLALWTAVGVIPSRLRLVWAFEGAFLGSTAALVGTVLGALAAWSFRALPLLSTDAFYLPALPSRMLPQEAVLVAAACILSSTLAAWWASRSVVRVPAAEVLKTI